MTSRNGSSISYTSFNLPSVINAGAGTSSTLSYGAFRNRYKQIAVTPSSGTETTIYVAGLLEKVTRSSGTEYRHYIAGGRGAAAIYTRASSGTSSTYYLHRDHLGSPELITDSSGNEVVRPSFGAYGERRDGTDWSGPPSAADLTDLANTSRRGFTGHEHLDSVGLIHMNGRVYEPVAGRFLTADPIRIAGISQDANPYAYAWNNPLRIVDSSGFTEEDDPIVQQCRDGCPGNAPTEFPPVEVWGDSWDSQRDYAFDLEVQMASWGSGIDFAQQFDGTMERMTYGIDGVTVTAKEISPSTGLGSQPLPSSVQGEQTDERSPCKQWSIDLGNKLAAHSNDMATASATIITGGVMTTAAGLASGPSGTPVAAVGVAITGTGGWLGFFAGIVQFTAGVLQGYGGADYQNSLTALASLGSGAVVSRALGPLFHSRDLAVKGGAAATGGTYDLLAMYIEKLAPQSDKQCSQ